jgi:hypothetical protein
VEKRNGRKMSKDLSKFVTEEYKTVLMNTGFIWFVGKAKED